MPFLQEYTMLEELGRGAFATVYKVRHNDWGYIRAVRVLNEAVVNAESKTYQDFIRECKILLTLGNGNHPNIVHIYQPRLLDNRALVEMDYVDGLDILHFLKKERNFVSVEEVIRMAMQMSNALAYCHEDIYRFCMDREQDQLEDDPNDGSKVLLDEPKRQELIKKYKVIHNDIHSGNIMRREDGNFVLLDFGLAIYGDEVVRSSRHANGASEFKAPEKWQDESILTEQSDIYSFGVVLYQYLAGRVPFPFNKNISGYKAEFELGEAHQNATPPSIETLRKESFERKFKGQEYEKDYPQWLEDLILKCLAKNPADRYSNGRELYEAVLTGVLQMHPQDESLVQQELARLQNEVEQSRSVLKIANSNLSRLSGERDRLQQQVKQLEKDAGQYEVKVEQLEKKLAGKGRWKIFSCILLLSLLVSLGFLHHFYKLSASDQKNTIETSQIQEFTVNDISFKMVFVKGGTFKMGCDYGAEDEKPMHNVSVSDFYMGEYEVTQALWQEVMGTNINQQQDKAGTSDPLRGVGDDFPMYYVSYTEAGEFCERLNQRLRDKLPVGYSFALPTEAEWEYAARGNDSGNLYAYSGSNKLLDVGWYKDNSKIRTHEVGAKKGNEWGLYDMSGNVWEWCADGYGAYSESEQKISRTADSNSSRVLRGGAWNSGTFYCRITCRNAASPNSRNGNIGFRLALVHL